MTAESHLASNTLASVRALLHTADDSSHGPGSVTCQSCADFWKQATVHTPDVEAHAMLTCLASHIPAAPCPTGTCADCEGCRFELHEAMSAVALAAAGVEPDIAWGPGHTPAELDRHPNDWRQCLTCTSWVTEREQARLACRAHGVDAHRWLGKDDIPVR